MKPIIKFRADNINFYFEVKRDITKVYDNSGVGKTYFCESLKAVLNTCKDIGIYPVTDKDTGENIQTIIIDGLNINEKEITDKLSIKNAVIIIDEADMLFNRNNKLSEVVIKNESSKFILMVRSNIIGIPFTYSDYAKVKNCHNGMVIEYFKN